MANKELIVDTISENTTDNGIDIDGVKIKDDYFDFEEISTPANPAANRRKLYAKSDGIYVLDDAGVEEKFAVFSGGAVHLFFIGCDYNANYGNYRVRSLAGTGGQRFTFHVPDNFSSLVSLNLIAICSSGAAGSGRDIDLFSEYGAIDEDYDTHSESNTSITYDFTGKTDKIIEIDISSVFTSLDAGDYCGIFIDHNAIGGTLYYIGVELQYNI